MRENYSVDLFGFFEGGRFSSLEWEAFNNVKICAIGFAKDCISST